MLPTNVPHGRAGRTQQAPRGSRLVARVAQVVTRTKSPPAPAPVVTPAPEAPVKAPEAPAKAPEAAVAAPAAPKEPATAPAPVAEKADEKREESPTPKAPADSHVYLDKPQPNKATVLRNIVFVTSEVAPWSKTGGLGDVMGALPKALASRGHRVMVVAPRYANYPEAFDTGKRHSILGSEVGYFHHINKGVDYVFVDHPSFPRPGGFYSDEFGEYGDNAFRYSLLTLAALEAPLVLPLGDKGLYGQECVFMANDWHTSLVPVYLAAKYRRFGVYLGSRSILAIHNLKHQGVFPPRQFEILGLPGEWFGTVEYQYPPHQRMGAYEEEGRAVNFLKAGIAATDRLVTVSPGYADEIKTWMGGWGLEGIVASREYVLSGITNGIDTEVWDPRTDTRIAQQYDENTFVEGKAACKKALQEELGLPVQPDIPLVAFIGRLDNQKGADIMLQSMQQMLPNGNFQLVCLGTGLKDLEDGFRWLESTYRDKARGWVGFNVALSHRITAAADIVLMPSRFEPCGLNQLYAMRYGAVPVAHKTGGLKDTVIDFEPFAQPPKGTGWTYTSCDPQGLTWALGMALKTYFEHKEAFRAIQKRGMERDSSWDTAAQQYEQIMTWAMTDMPYCK